LSVLLGFASLTPTYAGYRWVMAGRTIEGIRTPMWNMVRMRIQDFLDIPVTCRVNTAHGVVNISASISELVTSEKGIAYILRWHINKPGYVIRRVNNQNVATDRLNNAISAAITGSPNLNWSLPIADWTDQHERAIFNALYTHAVESAPVVLGVTMTTVRDWPGAQNTLTEAGRGVNIISSTSLAG
jgi:hypothetical protein